MAAIPLGGRVQIGGPFQILTQQVWIKAQDRKPPVLGEAIVPTAVQAGSSDADAAAANLIDGRGLRDLNRDGLQEHSSDPARMWRCARGELQGAVEFDFGQSRRLGTILVWNYNDIWHTDRGVGKMDVSAWTPEAGWQKVRQSVSLDPAEGGDGYDEPTVIELDATAARKIRFENLVSLGDPEYVGLSAVQFFAPAPAPSGNPKSEARH